MSDDSRDASTMVPHVWSWLRATVASPGVYAIPYARGSCLIVLPVLMSDVVCTVLPVIDRFQFCVQPLFVPEGLYKIYATG